MGHFEAQESRFAVCIIAVQAESFMSFISKRMMWMLEISTSASRPDSFFWLAFDNVFSFWEKNRRQNRLSKNRILEIWCRITLFVIKLANKNPTRGPIVKRRNCHRSWPASFDRGAEFSTYFHALLWRAAYDAAKASYVVPEDLIHRFSRQWSIRLVACSVNYDNRALKTLSSVLG